MNDLKLYNFFRSSTSYRARIVLELKNLKYTYVPVSLSSGEQNQDSYRKVNSLGGVPTLDHNGKLISQSFAIAEYLDEVFDSGLQLLPADPYLRAKIRQVCEIINADTHPLQNLKVLQYLEKNLSASADQKQQWMNRWISDGVNAVENVISQFAGDYCFGNEPTVADAFLVPQVFSAARFNVDISACKNVLRVNENCIKHPAFVKAHPFRQPDTPADLKVN
jgi:maleylacetoacetate isomerase/maleylpyruvate isomerase